MLHQLLNVSIGIIGGADGPTQVFAALDNMDAILQALNIMGKGMLGIFAVILVIWALVALLNRVTGKQGDNAPRQ